MSSDFLTYHGIIPAYAGNTLLYQFGQHGSGDHPRVCGEHLFQRSDRQSGPGSSPRMRGTPCDLFLAAIEVGIIPAYAGNTDEFRKSSVILEDHPRVCGEHLPNNQVCRRNLGSSPRMRGTRLLRVLAGIGAGIIPAYAGNTNSISNWTCGSRDHPRVCGEHALSLIRVELAPGSSPRMRGTHSSEH